MRPYLLYHRGKPVAIVAAKNRRLAERGAGTVLYGTPQFPAMAKLRCQCPVDHWQGVIDDHCGQIWDKTAAFFEELTK